MTQIIVLDIMKDAFFTIMLVSAPVLLIALALGLIISIMQAATQVQEQSLSFVPKIIAVMLGLILFGNFMLNKLLTLTTDLYKLIPLFS